MGVDFLLRGTRRLASLGVVCDESLAGLVRVQLARLLAVGLGQLVLRGAGRDAEQVVECDVAALGLSDLVVQAKDFVV